MLTKLKPIAVIIVVSFLAIDFTGCENEFVDSGPNPVLMSLAPMSGAVGQCITLSGKNLNKKTLFVKFSTNVLAEIKNKTDEEVQVTVPFGAITGTISVGYNSKTTAVSENQFLVTDIPPITDHTILIHENERIVTYILSQKEFDQLNANQYDGPDVYLFLDLYKMFNDDFDFILEIYNNTVTNDNYMKIPNGFSFTTSNAVSGIGLDLYNHTALVMGSNGKLKSVITIPRNDALNPTSWPVNLHEIMHTWANYGIPTEKLDANDKSVADRAHWGISGAGQILGGFDQTTLKTNVDGNPNKYSFALTANPWLTKYSNFELYLMGQIPLEEVMPFDVFTDLISGDYSGNSNNNTLIYNGVTYYGSDTFTFVANKRTTYDQQLILKTLGARNSSFYDSQKNFKMLIVVFSPTPLLSDQIQMMDTGAEALFRASADDNELVANFWEATYGKSTIEIGDLRKSLKK